MNTSTVQKSNLPIASRFFYTPPYIPSAFIQFFPQSPSTIIQNSIAATALVCPQFHENTHTQLLLTKNLNVDANEGHEDFKNIFLATVGLSSLSMDHSDPGLVWRQVQGPLCDHVSMSGGWTECEVEMSPEELRFKDILDQPHNWNKLLYFNPDQLKVLANNLPLVLLVGDYGSGRSKNIG